MPIGRECARSWKARSARWSGPRREHRRDELRSERRKAERTEMASRKEGRGSRGSLTHRRRRWKSLLRRRTKTLVNCLKLRPSIASDRMNCARLLQWSSPRRLLPFSRLVTAETATRRSSPKGPSVIRRNPTRQSARSSRRRRTRSSTVRSSSRS